MQIKCFIFPIMSFAFVVRAVAPLPKNAFYPGLFSSLGCASAKKFRLGRKRSLFGLGRQINIKNIAFQNFSYLDFQNILF
jgi:hypothetical protein